MAAVTARFEFANKICEILKIENINILRIEILIAPQDFVEVVIHKAMTKDEGFGILTELEKRTIPNEKEEINYEALIEKWHDPKTVTNLPLHEYLGMSKKQYVNWIKTNEDGTNS